MIGPTDTVGLHVTSIERERERERERGSSGEGGKVQAQSCLTNGTPSMHLVDTRS